MTQFDAEDLESGGGFAHVGPLKPIHVALDDRATHPLLRFSGLTHDAEGAWRLDWPSLTSEQRASVAGITVHRTDGESVLSIPPRVNLDFFVDEETDEDAAPFWMGRADDLQRYYTRVTDTQFLHVGTYTALTVDGVRRYFTWRAAEWAPMGLGMFVHVRDGDDTHFGETTRDELEKLSPGALASSPIRVQHDIAEEARDDDDDEEDLMSELDAMVQHGRASGIASIAHRGQVDKLGYDYIDHPARVSEAFDWLDEPVAHCAAWLHDVLRDSDISAKDLVAAGILPEIVKVVELLTRSTDPLDSIVYYELIRQDPVARAVKLADIADNTADWRFRKLDMDTQIRLSHKYFAARAKLGPDDPEPN